MTSIPSDADRRLMAREQSVDDIKANARVRLPAPPRFWVRRGWWPCIGQLDRAARAALPEQAGAKVHLATFNSVNAGAAAPLRRRARVRRSRVRVRTPITWRWPAGHAMTARLRQRQDGGLWPIYK